MADLSLFSGLFNQIILLGVFFVVVGILFVACLSIIVYTFSLLLAGYWISLKENTLGQAFTSAAFICAVTAVLTIAGVFFNEIFVIAFLLLLILPTIVIMLVYNLSFSKAALLQYCAIPMHCLITFTMVVIFGLLAYYCFDFSIQNKLENLEQEKQVKIMNSKDNSVSFLPPPENNEFQAKELIVKNVDTSKSSTGGLRKQQAAKKIKPNSKTMIVNSNKSKKAEYQ